MAVVALLIAAGLCLPPLVVLLVESVTAGTASGIPAGRLIELLSGTVQLIVVVTIGAVILGTIAALLVSRTNLSGRRMFSLLVMVPLALPAYLLALSLVSLGGGAGLISQLLAPLGLGPVPVAQGLWAAAICLIVSNLPIVHALVVTALNRLDPALEESARLVGDPPFRVFFRVILPQLRTPLTTAACIVSLYTLSDFGAVSVLRYDTFTRAVYSQFRGGVDLASAFSLVGVLISMATVLIVLQTILGGRPMPVASRARPPLALRLSLPGRIAARAALWCVVLLSLIVPVATLTVWAVRGLISGVLVGPIIAETANTLQLALVAAVVTTLIAIPIALSSYRGTSRLGRIAETLPWITHSLPHLAIGVGFLIVSLALPPVFYQSSTMLILVYAAIFLPVAVGAQQLALRQIDPRLFEVSRILGQGAWSTGRRVGVALVWRAAMTGALIVAVLVSQELPATLLLRPTGTETLAIRVWGAVSEGQLTTGSIAALLLMAISVPLVAGHHRATLRVRQT
ncbi:iron ABC transporter permease [Salinibacterium sp. G-O1]|uniref:ABC transporter permease n=1 Tax=Salinibacterium sp. G-O1 TaxID=3046208 RepID=UPI0024BAC64A|nr:iron ABC transporter permease [Salinibacterium sp. G-O1]MDJ0333985.1 iron ABC transporter permease [Salinibacterium sp. G-O1]